MLGIRLIDSMLSKQTSEEANISLEKLFAVQKQQDSVDMIEDLPKGFEIRLSMVFRDTLYIRFSLDDAVRERAIGRFMAFASLAVTEKFSPNTMEL